MNLDQKPCHIVYIFLSNLPNGRTPLLVLSSKLENNTGGKPRLEDFDANPPAFVLLGNAKSNPVTRNANLARAYQHIKISLNC